MANLYKLSIITPGDRKIEEDVISVNIATSEGRAEFLANHAESIISVVPTVTVFVNSKGEKKYIFTSVGVGYYKGNTFKIICDSVNWPEEIDMLRAEEAANRARERLKSKDAIDRERATRALARALARLELKK